MLARWSLPLVVLLVVLLPTAALAQPAPLTVDDTTPNAGQTINASGTGCAAAAAVTYELDERQIAPTGRADNAGTFAVNILIPETTTVGRHTLTALCGTRLLATALDVAAQGAGVLTVGPRLNPRQGETVAVSGAGCRTQTDVSFFVGLRQITPNARSDNAGRFTANVLIPRDTPIGVTTITARCGPHSLARQVEVLAAGAQVGQVPRGGVQTGLAEPSSDQPLGVLLGLGATGLVVLVLAVGRRRAGRSA